MFQTRLKELREAAGYKSQQALADALGTSQSTVGNWESGRRYPKRTTMLELAQFFGVSVDDLLGQGGEKEQLPAENEELSADEKRLLNAYRAASGKRREAVLDLLED